MARGFESKSVTDQQEAKDWVRPIALSVGVCLFCYFLFVVWIKLSFPKGILF